ncbi:M14 family zinc carboxypeptidase [Carboxylicivirga caseinilyticus]|uniref:M14 family zinc carboxypeptidase n=1 Tax=Carboxylicivirga caseinilyticus TaxID=3417572 RepID=UPI003D3384C4|nr:hypothetical protein [Marinilabiliaceae bacterium A049]
MQKHVGFFLAGLMLLSIPIKAQKEEHFKSYHKTSEITTLLKSIKDQSNGKVKLHNIATSPGSNQLTVIEVGADLKNVPAVFVAANMQGVNPLSTEGALYLTEYLTAHKELNKELKWYILPVGNPDAAQNFFAVSKIKSPKNAFAVNDDMDEQTNEDGVEDLNGDGFITMMRVKKPDGEYSISKTDSLLMTKDEDGDGGWTLYSEGTDNDGDGLFNEDGLGGINPGINFPHAFKYFDKVSGLWPGYASETYGIMKFIYDHPEINMCITLGESSLLTNIPEPGKGGFDPEKVKLNSRIARISGLSPQQTYSVKEVVKAISDAHPEYDIEESDVVGMLMEKALTDFQKQDLSFYKDLSKKYQTNLKKQGYQTKRIKPEDPLNGSIELWAYFQLGVPSLSVNLWTPEIKSDTTKTKKDKVEATKKAKPGKEEQLLEYYKNTNQKAFVDWQVYNHPQLGEVEIGGLIPFMDNTPVEDSIASILAKQIPALASICSELPAFKFVGTKLSPLGGGVYRLETYLENIGNLPYPTYMGQINQQPAPLMVTLKGDGLSIIEGKERVRVKSVQSHHAQKLVWVIKAGKSDVLKLATSCPAIVNIEQEVKIEK